MEKNKTILRQYIRKLINESSFDEYDEEYNETFWAWVSPDNKLITVPKMSHAGFIGKQYSKLNISQAIEQALKDGWVRVVYQYDENKNLGELFVNSINEKRASILPSMSVRL